MINSEEKIYNAHDTGTLSWSAVDDLMTVDDCAFSHSQMKIKIDSDVGCWLNFRVDIKFWVLIER